MKSVLVLSALLFARAVFAQDSLSTDSATSTTPTDSVVSATPTDSADFASSSSSSISATITDSSSSASHTGSAKAKGTSSSAPAAAATGASYTIPSGISSDCSKFLKALDSDATLGSCTAPLLAASSNFGPGSNTSQNQNTLTSALNKLCSNPGCSDKYIRTQLTNFGTACQAELDPSSGNKSVRDTYDILYVMQPWLAAICTKDTDGTYCATKAPSDSSSSSDQTGTVRRSHISSSDSDIVNYAIGGFYAAGISSPKKRAQTVYAPDTASYRESGVMYMYTLPTLSKESLCTTCTQKILESYAEWEATVPYASGLSNSPMLGGQGQLWEAAKEKCGDSFMNVVTSTVGTANAEKNAGVPATQVGVSSAVAGVFAVAMGFWAAL